MWIYTPTPPIPTEAAMPCKPKVKPQVITIPTKPMKCCNCSCRVKPGRCHCGATNEWRWDELDGWYESGSITHRIFKQKDQ